MARFLDTNVIVRFLTDDHPEKSARALALFQSVDRGDVELVTSPMVIFETVFTLQKTYGAARLAIKQGVETVISLRGVRLVNKKLYRNALGLYAATKLSFADAYNAEFMKASQLSEIYSWDSDFDKLPDTTRIKP